MSKKKLNTKERRELLAAQKIIANVDVIKAPLPLIDEVEPDEEPIRHRIKSQRACFHCGRLYRKEVI